EIKGRRRTVDYVHDPSIGPPVYQQACFPDRYANLLTHIKLPEIGAIDQGNRAKRHREDAACAFVLLASQTQAPARMAPISRRLIARRERNMVKTDEHVRRRAKTTESRAVM